MKLRRPRSEALDAAPGELAGTVLPRLRGRVFHVTRASALESIFRDGMIRWNYGEPTYPDAHARHHRYVAVCDLRFVSDDDLRSARIGYDFLSPFPGEDPAFLFLKAASYGRLLTRRWERQWQGEFEGEMIVPHIEAGFPGDLPTSLIESALSVRIRRA